MKDGFKNKFLISTAVLAGITLVGATNTAHAADNVQEINVAGQSTANQLKAKLANDQQSVNNYQQKVTQGQQNVASDEAALQNAQTAQKQGQSTLSAAQQRQQAAQSAYDQQAADVQAKQAAVDQTKQDLSAAQDELSTAQSSAGSASSSASSSSSAATSSSASTSETTSGSSSTSSSASSSASGSSATSAGSSATSSSSSASSSDSAAALQHAQAAVRDAQSKQDAAQTAFNQASADVADKSAAAERAQQAAKQANQKVSADQSAVDTAQQKVTDLQKVAHTDVAALQQEVNQLEEKLRNDQQAVTDAQTALAQAKTDLETAKQAVNKASDDLTKAQQDAKAAQDKLNADQQAAQEKQQAAQDAKKAMDQAKAKLDALKNGTASENDPIAQQAPAKVPAGFAEGMAGYVLGGTNTQGNIDYARKALTDNGFDPDNINGVSFVGYYDKNGNPVYQAKYKDNFQHNQADQATILSYDGNKLMLTNSQKQELTSYVANIVNRIRQNVQSQPDGQNYSLGFLKVSPFATQLGEKLVDSAYNHGWDKATEKVKTGSPHNPDGLKEVANQAGINTGFVGENMSSGKNYQGTALLMHVSGQNTISMDAVKESLYITIMSMMYSDNYGKPGFGGHTTAFLNDPQEGENHTFNYITKDPKVNQYLAVSFNDNDGSVHFNFISDANATPEVKKNLAQDATTPGIDQQSSVSQDDINAAQQDYDQKKAASEKADQEAKTALETVKNDQTEVKKASDAVSTAQQKLDSAKKAAQEAQTTVNTKQQAVTDTQNTVKTTQGQINEKKTALDAAGKSKDDQAKELQQAQKDLQTAKDTLTADQKLRQTKQQAAQDAQSALKKAQDNLATKKTALDNAKKELTSAKEQLNQLEESNLKGSLAMRLFAQSYARLAAALPSEQSSDLSARVSQLQQKLSADQAALENSQKALATKKAELDAANEALAKIQDGATIADLEAQLEKDRQQLTQDQAILVKHQQAVKDDLAALARLQQGTTGSQTTDQSTDETISSGSTGLSGHHQNGSVVTTGYQPTIGAASTATVAFPGESVNASTIQHKTPSITISHKAQSRLPQTGNADNQTALVGLVLIEMISLFGWGALKKQN
ncbi:MAG: SEC10/PgrA surface exclusion domain-containing protein [Limosilactobacillus sp.]|jgi:SEC10/PgrA surface exclusion-like protein|uniref:SEC10/PgrA surface exclusion domain-containing protein n=1 Tax=Limosilactobacillus sp. TaxID=2773925 RepID=UPI0025C3DF3E|nr:SEC10/PgrA surface exclusion domain-containing protein [Limosilactobacillus sp.]MCI1975571.1 SEC10/PgrA surface exclusion domain-containing protein [Limosilactobacillus sp.]MCI2030974.1 SEC10/PgrA surface exclusion domain-containing protein [Limosilactobacillus sp.]